MASKEGGFGFGTIVMGIIFYNLFFGGDDTDKTEVRVETEEDVQIVETVKQHVDELKPEVDALVQKAKVEFDKVKDELTEKAKDRTAEKAKNDTTEKPKNDDPFAQDDLYGSSEDKY